MEYYHWDIEGWLTVEQTKLYKRMVDTASDGAHFVEIGCWKGKSTVMMGVEINNSGKKIKFDAIDSFMGSGEHQAYESIQNNTLQKEFLANIEPVKHIVNPIVGDSSSLASRYPDKSIDFLFIDGDHSFEGVMKDIQAWLPKMKEGGVIAGDDFGVKDFPGVVEAVTTCLSDVTQFGQIWCSKIPKSVKHKFHTKHDDGVNLNSNYNSEIEGAYIICLKDNIISDTRLELCIQSLQRAGMKYKLFHGYDGSDRKQIKTPDHLKNNDYMKWIKVVDSKMSYPEIGCTLSHVALWAHCITINKPIVILEHDAVMLQPYTHFPFYNCLHYLGHNYIAQEMISDKNLKNDYCYLIDYLNENTQKEKLDNAMLNYGSENYFFPMGQHAYAIDPAMAKRLFTACLLEGIKNVNDVFCDSSKFEFVYTKLYATQLFDCEKVSTICTKYDSIQVRKEITTCPGVSL
jgi:GR25 family glycosyltransferase involved in LPS biosynthesis/predicted O-methyltransferase YrrM